MTEYSSVNFISFLSMKLSDNIIAGRRQTSRFPGVYGIEQHNSRSKAESNCQILYGPRKLKSFSSYPNAEGMNRFQNEAGKYRLIAMGNIVAISMPTPEADFSWSDRFFRSHNKSRRAVAWNKQVIHCLALEENKANQRVRYPRSVTSPVHQRTTLEYADHEVKNCRIYRKLVSSFPYSAHQQNISQETEGAKQVQTSLDQGGVLSICDLACMCMHSLASHIVTAHVET